MDNKEKIENKLLITLDILSYKLDIALENLGYLNDDFRSYEWLLIYGLYALPGHKISMIDYKKNLETRFPSKSNQFIKVQATRRSAKQIKTGYVCKVVDKDDKRKNWLSLTNKGIEIVENVLNELIRLEQK